MLLKLSCSRGLGAIFCYENNDSEKSNAMYLKCIDKYHLIFYQRIVCGVSASCKAGEWYPCEGKAFPNGGFPSIPDHEDYKPQWRPHMNFVAAARSVVSNVFELQMEVSCNFCYMAEVPFDPNSRSFLSYHC
jgi:hypothetical protein